MGKRRRERGEAEEHREEEGERRETERVTPGVCGGAQTATAAAVGRKFKIEYLASNFHRSSKNRAVSYLAGGLIRSPARLSA